MDRDNQQETVTEGEVAWLAGIIEGEGTVALSCWCRSERTKPKIGVEIKLNNTDAGIVEKAIEIIRKMGISPYITQRSQRPMEMASGSSYGGTDPMLMVIVKRLDETLKLARALEPWMFGDKLHRMRLVIKYLESRQEKIAAKGRQVPLCSDDIEIVAEFYRNHVKCNTANVAMVDRLLRDFTCGAPYTKTTFGGWAQ